MAPYFGVGSIRVISGSVRPDELNINKNNSCVKHKSIGNEIFSKYEILSIDEDPHKKPPTDNPDSHEFYSCPSVNISDTRAKKKTAPGPNNPGRSV